MTIRTLVAAVAVVVFAPTASAATFKPSVSPPPKVSRQMHVVSLAPAGRFSRATRVAGRLRRSDRTRVDEGSALASRTLWLRGRARDPGTARGGGRPARPGGRERPRRSARPLPRTTRAETSADGDAQRSAPLDHRPNDRAPLRVAVRSLARRPRPRPVAWQPDDRGRDDRHRRGRRAGPRGEGRRALDGGAGRHADPGSRSERCRRPRYRRRLPDRRQRR